MYNNHYNINIQFVRNSTNVQREHAMLYEFSMLTNKLLKSKQKDHFDATKELSFRGKNTDKFENFLLDVESFISNHEHWIENASVHINGEKPADLFTISYGNDNDWGIDVVRHLKHGSDITEITEDMTLEQDHLQELVDIARKSPHDGIALVESPGRDPYVYFYKNYMQSRDSEVTYLRTDEGKGVLRYEVESIDYKNKNFYAINDMMYFYGVDQAVRDLNEKMREIAAQTP